MLPTESPSSLARMQFDETAAQELRPWEPSLTGGVVKHDLKNVYFHWCYIKCCKLLNTMGKAMAILKS